MTPPSASMSGAVLGVDVPGKREGGWVSAVAEPTVVLGIDVPGTSLGGYAVVNETGKVLASGLIDFRSKRRSERADYRKFYTLLSRLKRRYHVDVLAIERPFLYIIAQWIGAIKMWTASKYQGDILGWVVLGSSQARKIVLGSGVVPKEGVLQYAIHWTGDSTLTQHQADAILYAHAYLAKPSFDEVVSGRHWMSKKYKAWRASVIHRDGKKCRRCGKVNLRGRMLQVHHVVPVSERPERRYQLSNGEVLCLPCHTSHEQRGRKKPAGFGARLSAALTGKPKSLAHRKALVRAWKQRKVTTLEKGGV